MGMGEVGSCDEPTQEAADASAPQLRLVVVDVALPVSTARVWA